MYWDDLRPSEKHPSLGRSETRAGGLMISMYRFCASAAAGMCLCLFLSSASRSLVPTFCRGLLQWLLALPNDGLYTVIYETACRV